MHYRSCNDCSAEVSESNHNLHRKMVEVLLSNEIPGHEDFLVHMRGGPDNFDEDGFVVHCDHHFLAQMDEAFGPHVDIY